MRTDTRQRALSAPALMTTRTEGPLGTEQITDQDWNRIALETWSHTQDEIFQRQPRATTPAAALMALDHVLRNEDLFAERDECADQQMLWLLIKAARDYIASR